MLPPPRLLSVATAVPPILLRQMEVLERARHVFGSRRDDIERLLPAFGNAGIGTRYSCVPLEWFESDHGWRERNALFVEHALALLESAAASALDRAGLEPAQIDAIVVVSTTGISTPSLDALLIERMPFRRDIHRLPVFGLGCAGGVIGLARAAMIAAALSGGRVLFLVVELCSLTFRAGDSSKSNVIAAALFGDGAAAAVVGPGDGPEIAGWGEYTWPASLEVMGWHVEDDGLGVQFSRDIPQLVRGRFRDAMVTYLDRYGLGLADVDAFVCHPGGAKVVAALEETLSLSPGALADARAVLHDYGNMSAATVMFVLERSLAASRPRCMVLSALGPGFTAAFLALRGA